MRYPSPVGKTFGYLKVTDKFITKKRAKYFLCECICGGTKYVSMKSLHYTDRVSCGCRRDIQRVCPQGQWGKYLVKNLLTSYVKNLLRKGTNLRNKDMPNSLVKLKREQIQLYRLIKEQKNGRKET